MSEHTTTATTPAPGGCCGNPPQPGLALPEAAAEAGSPCCGTAAEARQEGSCCGAAAKQDAVASGQGCCG
ncbi:hypothetical protein GCM10010168_50160 [Actinoplanes ianthinogenes]|uniref:Uncharacterized protein n=1 Tax=Actinoplanes ianthinogenes TaxID=122358 RepID=A0ABM7M360_9ACTN|nr:hypothetical protein [Actinoplanes ianthinogenes]BCJ46068.1 hypothetical protein Aiant_67250 [Actinoplanes ianthinogenes]GGR25987.1 hypothetical protein GCM10010168_50160 [Actinoplanes ianthinogenes]